MTKQNTDYRMKGQAVFLAALMVISMVAVPMAFAGGAAAIQDTAQVSFDNQDLDDGEVTVGLTDVDDDGAVVVTYEEDGELIVAGVATVEDGDDEVSVEIEDDGNFPGLHTAHLIAEGDLSGSYEAGDEVSSDTANEVIDAETAYVWDDLSQAPFADGGDFYVGQELFVTDIPTGTDELRLRPWDGDRAGSTVRVIDVEDGVAAFAPPEDGEFVLTDGSDRTQAVTTNPAGTFDEFEDASNSNSIEVLDQDLSVEFDEDEVENQGTTSVDFEIESDLRNSYNVEISVDGFDEDQYEQVFVEGNLASSASVDSFDDDSIILRSAEGTHSLNFSGIDADDYEFEVDVTDSSASASDSIEVVDGEDADVSFVEDTVDVSQGDVAEIDVTVEGGQETATLIIGEFADDGYQAIVEISEIDESEFTIEFNTYLAGTEEDGIFSSEDAEVELVNVDETEQNDIDGILDVDDYDMYLNPGLFTDDNEVDNSTEISDWVDNSDEVGALFINDRNVGGMNLWTASADNAGDIEDGDDIADAIDEGLLTETDTIAFGDALVHQIELDGIGGFIAATDEDDLDDALLELIQQEDVVDIVVEQTDETRQANRQAKTLDTDSLTAGDIEVVYEGGELFVIFSELPTDSDNWDRERTPADGDEFTVDLEVTDQRILEVGDNQDTKFNELSEDDEDSALVIGSEFGVADREASFDVENVDGDDVVTVENAEEQDVTGTSNIAPGSEFNVRLNGQGDARFVKTVNDVVVQPDGTFSAEFDFSAQSVGDEFEAQIRQGSFDERPTADGLVVDAEVEETETEETEETETETPTEEPTEEPTEDPTEEPTEEPTEAPSDDGDDGETGDDTPGFGALVALVALIGAAMLAVRRQN